MSSNQRNFSVNLQTLEGSRDPPRSGEFPVRREPGPAAEDPPPPPDRQVGGTL